ncbi:MAG: methyltransferase domain-containing protein, partial [Pseudomonadota bacterium]
RLRMTDGYPTNLWTATRTVKDTQALYTDWAASYDADVIGAGYATPARIAKILSDLLGAEGMSNPLLDFGCGTGLSGVALRAAGFKTVDGCEINPDMIAQLKARPEVRAAYREIWQADPESFAPGPGAYDVIACVGVISAGAAPAETLDFVLDQLHVGGIIAFSYNDATREDPAYLAALNRALDGRAEQVVKNYGPHLPSKNMGSDIYVLRRL